MSLQRVLQRGGSGAGCPSPGSGSEPAPRAPMRSAGLAATIRPAMPLEPVTSIETATAPRVEYRGVEGAAALPDDVLAAVTFGASHAWERLARCVRVGLRPLRGAGITELWHACDAVRFGFDGLVRYACDSHHLLGAIEVDEREFGGIAAAAEATYTALHRFQARSAHPYLLRVWNYFDAINAGAGDAERYRQFCVGRANALGRQAVKSFPAATAIGRRDGRPVLQVYWFAGRSPGVPLENPRQLSAYRYPRQYGPAAPAFSRAMLVSDRLLMISGTASIVGHASHHPGDVRAQLEETLANLASVLQRAVAMAPKLPARLGAGSLLKVYLREAGAAGLVEAVLRERLPPETPCIILEADICRAELLVEMDCIHGGPAAPRGL